MTTNQTIDGVPRELLERIMHGCMFSLSRQQHEELRALLDEPEVLVVPLTGPKEWLDSLKPAAQPQGEPVVCVELVENKTHGGMHIVKWDNLGKLKEGIHKLYAEQSAPHSALKAFANVMITAAFEGGSFDGGDIQDIAVKHGLLRIERREEECGEVCACRSEGDGFPAECYRKTALLRGEQPAPVAANSLAVAELRHILDSNKGAGGTLVISKKLAAQILGTK